MKPPVLLSRDSFRAAVFERDGHRCVFCKRSAKETREGKLDAHHIIERRGFTAPHELGGYFVDNGSTVCEDHHRLCEQTVISVEEARMACGITRAIIPSHLYDDQIYDKWMNSILPNGQRVRGELFADESVQKIMATGGVLGLFSKYWKHPRLHHLPWSPGMQSDDRMFEDISAFEGREVIVTEKADGEQTTIYNDYIHARSIDSGGHPSRNRLKAWAAQWQFQLDDDLRVCGENVFARHSIVYDETNPLPHHFLGFSMWQDDKCLPWDDTMDYFAILGISPVKEIWRGTFDARAIESLYDPKTDWENREGYVVRLTDGFSYRDFRRSVAKYVRKGHVQTAQHHWSAQPVVPNTFTSA